MRLIDADAFKEYLKNAFEEVKHVYADGGVFAWRITEDFCRDIDEQPTIKAEPERKTAEWIYGENGGQDGWYCSKCGLFIPWDYEYYGLDNIDFIADFHTCPKCDRKMLKYTGMRGEQE